MPNLKVGRIDFLNILPLYYYFEEFANPNIEIVNRVPSILNNMLKLGEIDMGPISSFAYAENIDEYILLPNLSVSSNGCVRSIFLFSKKPIEFLNQGTIALTNTSETSIHLLKIILDKYFHFDNTYNVMAPDLPEMLKEHDAALLIGDDAFVESNEFTNQLYKYDLGELWKELTSYSMTFAVWAVRKESILNYDREIREVYQAFIESKTKGLRHLDTIINIANNKFERGTEFWRDYFSGLIYDLDDDIIKGLNQYFLDAYSCGFLPKPVTATVWGDIHVSY